ncbi:hypothetical protein GCM10009104_21440 [Marinobacterium maritimum]|uniref:Uncharacterized protein n=1 Tax=Marinobacterium maritimum TaxID=500162 RepID=A0ABP3TCR7_9GAMM
MNLTLNASVSNPAPAKPVSLKATERMNRMPVKVDASGGLWIEGRPLVCPPIFPCSSRGELVFSPGETGVLLGPWGPDPDHHLILSGRLSGQQEGRLILTLDSGLMLQACHPVNTSASLELRPRQRLWLSIPLSALEYRR